MALGPTATNRHLISEMRSLPLRRKTTCEKHDLVQSGKNSLKSWPDVKLIPQTNNCGIPCWHMACCPSEAVLHRGQRVPLLQIGTSSHRFDNPSHSVKVTHNTCSLHLATHFQNQTSHMGMFYMVYWWQGWSLNVIT